MRRATSATLSPEPAAKAPCPGGLKLPPQRRAVAGSPRTTMRATIEAYIRPAVVAIGAALMLVGVYHLAGWWGLATALGAILLLFGALG